VGIAYFDTALASPELLFVEMTNSLFHPFVAGIFLCGVVAATMSTMDSQILICASVISEDLCRMMMSKKPTERTMLIVTRAAVVVSALASLTMALTNNASILEAVKYAWTGLGCSFGPLVLAALYAPRTNRFGAAAGIIVGALIAAFWDSINGYLTAYTISAMIPGVLFGSLAIYIVSRLTQHKTRQLQEG
jgi:sodium/proline symporter